MAQIKLAEYTFDNSVGDIMPSLTPNTITMTKEDSVSGTTTRRIVYIDDSVMPTQIGGFHQATALLTLDYLNVTNSVTAIDGMFYQATNVTYINVSNWDTSNVINMKSTFYQCTKLQTIEGLENWNVSKNTTFSMTFYRCEKLQEANITNWKAPLCTSMHQMFRQCYQLKNLDLSGFEVSTTSSVDMSRCFQQCDNLKITGLNTMKVKPTNLIYTFANLTSTTIKNNFDLSSWDTSLCTDMNNMFSGCSSLTSLNLSSWDTSLCTNFSGMFNGCTQLIEIKGIENFNVSSVTNFSNMFYQCQSLTKLDLRNWMTSSAYDMAHMFNSCSSLEVLRVDNFDTSKLGDSKMNSMFYGCSSLKTLNLNSFIRSTNLTKVTGFLQHCSSLEYLSMQNFDFSGIVTFQSCFNSCKSLKMLDLTMWDTSSVNDATFTYCFNGVTCPIYYNSNICKNNGISNYGNAIDVQGRLLAVYDFNNTVTTSNSAYPTLTGSVVTKTIDTQGSESYITHRVIGVDVMPTGIKFNSIPGLLNVDYLAVTSTTTSLHNLFGNCIRMASVNTFGWDTSNVTTMETAFGVCSSLTELDLSSCNLQNLQNLYGAFADCSGLETLHLPTTFTTSFISLGRTFWNCSKLSTITGLSEIDTSKVVNFDMTFARATSLMEIDLSKWNTSSATGSTGMFDYWTSDQIVYIHDTNWTLNTSSYNATFVRRLSKLIIKYTFDNSTHPSCLPRFNNQAGNGTTVDYMVSDMVKGNITTRLLSTNGDLPQHIQFADDFYTGGRGIISCDYLDTSNCTSLYLLFYGCSTLTSVNTSSWDTSKVTNFYCAFFNTRCTEIDCSNIDTSSAVNISRMFGSCSTLTSLDLSSWDVSKVTDFSRLFQSCYGLKSLNTSGWDTSSVINMDSMFDGCGLTEIDVSHFNTSNATNLNNMFAGVKISSIDLSGWDVRKVQQTRLMFNSGSITEIKLDGWNTESLTDMWAMFCGSGITTVDINHFNVSKVTSVSQLFDQCKNLVSVDMSNLHFTSCQNISSMFSRCPKLTTVKMADFTGSPITTVKSLCYQSSVLTEIDLTTVDVSRVTDMSNVFELATSLKTLDLSTWDTRKVTSANAMFQGWDNTQTVYYEPPFWSIGTTTLNSNINWVINVTRNNGYWLDMTGITEPVTMTLTNDNGLPTEDIVTSWGDGTVDSELTHTYSIAGEYIIVTNLQNGGNYNTMQSYVTKAIVRHKQKPDNMFYNCSKLEEVQFTQNWATSLSSQTHNFWRMFYNCLNLKTINTDVLCQVKPNGLSFAFYYCQSLETLDLSSMDVSNCTSLECAFRTCNKLQTLNLSNWDTSKVSNFWCAFAYDAVLTEIINIENLNTSNATNMGEMFNGCKTLTSLDVSNWNFTKCTTINQFIRDTTNLVDFNMSGVTFGATSVNFQNFAYQSGVQNVNMSNITTAGKVSFESPFYGCSKLKTIDFSNSHFKPSNMQNMFQNCSSLTSLDLSMLDTSLCTNMNNTFYGCGVATLNLKGWNTSNVTTMVRTFADMTNITTLDLSHFDTSNVTNMQYVVTNCPKLTYIDVSSFTRKTSSTIIDYLFLDNPSLENIDISNLDMTNMSTFMFRDSSKLKTIGMLYSSGESINKLVANGFHKTEQRNGITIYYQDADPSQLTPVEGVTFKKYQTPTTIQLPPHIQLHSLPDGTRDEVDIKTGILTRRAYRVKITGSNSNINYTIRDVDVHGAITMQCTINDAPKRRFSQGMTKTYCDFKVIPFVGGISFTESGKEKIGCGWYGSTNLTNTFCIRIPISYLEELTLEAFKELLNKNPIDIVYELETPIVEQLILNYNNSCDYGRILPTGMCDKYDVVNSMYTQTMTSILLDGANTWDAMEEFENTVKFTATGTTVGVEELNMLGAGGLYCDNDLFPNINDDSDVPHCRVDEAGNKFYIYVDKEMLMSPDLIGWQIWLQANPFNLIYELAEHLIYVKPYEELDPTQARWEGMDCMRDGAIKYHTNSSDNITMYPTLEYVAPSINNFEVTMLEPNTDYTIYAEGINTNDTINLGGTDIKFNNGTVYTSGDNQWLRIDNNDSFYNMVITKGDTTGEVVPYFEGMTSVENPNITMLASSTNRYNGYEVGAFNSSTGIVDTTIGNTYVTNFIYIGDGVNLKTNLPDRCVWYYYDENKNYVDTGWHEDSNSNPILLYYENTYYVRVVIRGGCEQVFLSTDIMIADKNNYPTTYEPYKEPSTVSYTDLKLRSLPNGVKDTINVVTGEYIQRVGEVVLDGSQKIENTYNVIGKTKGFYYPPNIIPLTGLFVYDYPSLISCSHFNVRVILDQWDEKYKDEEFISVADDGRVAVRLQTTKAYTDEEFYDYLSKNPITILYPLPTPIITKLDPQTLLAYKDGTINLSSDTGLLPTTHYTVPSTNTFHLPSMKTGTRYTLKYPSASGSITIGDINYSISSDSMLFTTPLKINGDTSAIIFSDANPENVVLLEGAYNKREVPFFTGVKSVKNPNITIIDQLSTESTTYNCETEIELRGLPNGVADKLDIIKGKLTTNVGIRAYQDGDENLPNIWTDGYETVYALSSPVVTNVTIDHPTVTTNSLIDLTSDYLIPQLNYRAPSSNNFPLDLLQPNQTYTLYADTLTSGSYILGGTRTGVYSQPHTITLGDMTDNLLTFNGDLGLSNVMLVKGNSLKTTLPPYFLGIRSVTDGHLLVEGMAGEINELTFDEGIVLRDCNGVKDFIDLMTCTLTKRTGEITLTGAEGWYRADNESTTDYNVFKLTLGGLKEALVMCDTLQSVFDTKMMDCIHAHTNELCIVIANATIGGNTVNALKSWLNQHPTTVVYQLRTPLEVQLENTWTTLPPTSYSNQTEISSTVSTSSLKPMISVTIATTTLEEIVSNLEAQNAELENENVATMLALTSVYETMVVPMAVATMSLDDEVSTVNLSDGKDGNNVNGMSVSPIGMVYVNLIRKGLKTIEQVPHNLQPEVMYALRGVE